ncbi:unnamed protein product, partial [Didymodactylos carnosus]
LLQDNQTRFTTVEQSPYEEVAAYVSNTDDSSLPCSTFRSWTIGILFVVIKQCSTIEIIPNGRPINVRKNHRSTFDEWHPPGFSEATLPSQATNRKM